MENLLINCQTGILFLISYLRGSIPFGYLIFKIKNNNDIRNYGSGNIGNKCKSAIRKKVRTYFIISYCKTFIVSYIFFNTLVLTWDQFVVFFLL